MKFLETNFLMPAVIFKGSGSLVIGTKKVLSMRFTLFITNSLLEAAKWDVSGQFSIKSPKSMLFARFSGAIDNTY